MLDLLLKWSGMGWLLDAIDGYKTYIGAISEILTGLGGLCVAANNLLVEFQATHGARSMLDFASSLSHDPNAAAAGVAWLAISHGFTSIGQRHAHQKVADILAAGAAAPSPAPVPGSSPAPASSAQETLPH